MRTNGHVDAVVYVQVEPEWYRYGSAGSDERPLTGAKFARATQQRPTSPKPGAVLLKLTLRIPAAAFYPLRPEAIVVVPETLTEATPVEVTAEDPHVAADSGER